MRLFFIVAKVENRISTVYTIMATLLWLSNYEWKRSKMGGYWDLWTLHVISSSDELKVTGHDITSQSRVSWEGRRALCRYKAECKRKHLAVQVAPTLIVLRWKSHAWLILPCSCSTVPGPWFLSSHIRRCLSLNRSTFPWRAVGRISPASLLSMHVCWHPAADSLVFLGLGPPVALRKAKNVKWAHHFHLMDESE